MKLVSVNVVQGKLVRGCHKVFDKLLDTLKIGFPSPLTKPPYFKVLFHFFFDDAHTYLLRLE